MGSWQRLLMLWVSIGCILLLVSCSDSDEGPNDPPAIFEFRVNNGTLVQWNGPGSGMAVCVLCGPSLYKNNGYFNLVSSAPQNYGEALVLRINTGTINLTTYSDTITTAIDSLAAVHRIDTPAVKAAATQEGDFASVTFTAVKDGVYHDGTFRARLTSSPFGPTAEKVEIEGEFRNVKLY
jgi:hypothetical protein